MNRLQPTGPILQSPPRAEAQRFTYSSGDRPLAGYTIKRGIGRGGFGEVYYGTSDGGKEVALKLVQRNLEVELRGVGHCLNLKHPNLVGLYDIRQAENGDYWIVMEYVAGQNLADVIDAPAQSRDREGAETKPGSAIPASHGGLPLDEVHRWIEGICAGVAYLHDRGIVHRDLKPANIFMEDGIVKIGDYGLSKFITHSRRSGQTESVGTVHYMAPEIAGGRYGKEIDVYAAGVILYEMLTGQVPFEGESVGEVLMKHLTAEPDLTAVPERFRAIVGRALVKDPSRRYASIDRMVEDLSDAAGDAWSAAPVARTPRPDAAPTRGPLDLGESALVSAAPAAPRAAVPPPPPETGLWVSFLREDPVVCWLRRKWHGLSPNNPWHVIGFAVLVPLLLVGVFWGILPLVAGCYVAAALMVRWLKGPSAPPPAVHGGTAVRPLPAVARPDVHAVAAAATEFRAAPEQGAQAGRAIPSALFVLMALLLGTGLGLLTGGIVQAMGYDEEEAALLGTGCGFFVAGVALFRWFPHSRWWRTIAALFFGTCVGLAAGALGMAAWRRDDEAAIVGTGAGFLVGGLLLARAFRGLGWWRSLAAPLIGLGVGLLVFGLGVAWNFDDEVAAMLGTGCGLLVCGVSGYRLGLDRSAKHATHAVRPRRGGHWIGRTVAIGAATLLVLLVMAMMVRTTVSRRHAGATVVRGWSGIERSHRGPHGRACADIETIIRTYPFSHDRAREMKKIAVRPGLSADEQIHLIDAVLDEVQFVNDKAEVLLPLASSPELTSPARYHLSTNIDRIAYQSERERITQALLENLQTDSPQQDVQPPVEQAEPAPAPNDGARDEQGVHPSSGQSSTLDGAAASGTAQEHNE